MEYHGKKPKIGKDVFIAPNAVVLGDVEIGDGSSIWYGAVVRGDQTKIRIGKNTNIQDNCTLHSDPPSPLTIGDNVTVGHNAVVHGCTIEDDCLIGIGSVILNDAHVKTGSIIASGSVVRQGQTVGPQHLVAGIPAGVKKGLTTEDVEGNRDNARTYGDLAKKHIAASGSKADRR
ncbi:MAG TPA: gamma carbonic anhydrase family protein [Deltaproteobacteria bacterium]|nr:gamma carbonic anhydrase family protein [Deltaproteobacteria bacterium]